MIFGLNRVNNMEILTWTNLGIAIYAILLTLSIISLVDMDVKQGVWSNYVVNKRKLFISSILPLFTAIVLLIWTLKFWDYIGN